MDPAMNLVSLSCTRNCFFLSNSLASVHLASRNWSDDTKHAGVHEPSCTPG